MDKLEYMNEINILASHLVSDALEENDNDIATASKALFDHVIDWTVDRHQWVIAYVAGGSAEVLRNSPNHDSWKQAYSTESMDNLFIEHGLERFNSVRAFYAMYEDVADRVSYIIEQLEETDKLNNRGKDHGQPTKSSYQKDASHTD